MSKSKNPFPSTPSPDLEATLELTAEPHPFRAVVGGVLRDGKVLRIGESRELDEIASIFIHHPAELDGCLPRNPLRKLAGYVVALDVIAERIDDIPGGLRRLPTRIITVAGLDHPPQGWARTINQPDIWTSTDDLGEIEDFLNEMVSELRWYQMSEQNIR